MIASANARAFTRVTSAKLKRGVGAGRSSPKSTPRREGALEGAVTSGVVGLVVLPAAPDDADPGTRENTRGVRVGLARLTMAAVQLLSPWAGTHGVLREVDQYVAELFVARPAEG